MCVLEFGDVCYVRCKLYVIKIFERTINQVSNKISVKIRSFVSSQYLIEEIPR